MTRKNVFNIALSSFFILVILAYVTWVKHQYEKCEARGGVYFRHEMVCMEAKEIK